MARPDAITALPKRSTATQERRAAVMKLRLAGITDQQVLASHFCVNPGTISRDLQAIDNDLRLQALQDRAVEKGRDLQRIERLMSAMWERALRGEIQAQNMMHKWLKRRADILGYDATAVGVVVKDGGTANFATINLDDMTSEERFRAYATIEAESVTRDDDAIEAQSS